MPRLSKSKTTDVVDTPAVVNTPLTVAEAAVKVEKAKKPKAPKTETDVTVSTPVVTTTSVSTSASVSTPVVSTPVASDDAVVEDIEASIAAKSLEFSTKLNQLSSMIATLKTEYRSMEKVWARELKASQKLNSKKKKRAGNRAPSGFVKPTRISDELATFLGKDKGSEMARTDVTREINKYIRSHNLQDAANGRKINPDQKLQTLLKLKKTDELTYFNLQRYMSPHFQKAEKALAAAAAATTAV
jgi:upstream activation factor subunit UAF30